MIIIKTKSEIEKMKKGGRILAKVMKELARGVKAGVSTEELDLRAEKLIRRYKTRPSFKNYRGYPKTLCASVNHQVVHAIPRQDHILRQGDIIGLDLGLEADGYFVDMAITVPIGKVDKKTKKLIEVTKEALARGIKQAKAGNYIGDISWAIQKFVESQGLSVVRSLVGHGVGKEVHEEPRIPNFGEPKTGQKIEEGMTLAIEPMVNLGGHEVETREDGWTIETADGSLSAHFEHTIAVTKKGPQVLTK